MSNKYPLISICVTCYNYAEYVQTAIESVFAQTYPNLELIIINDGSTDNSDEIILKSLDKYKNAVNTQKQQIYDTVNYVNRENKGIVFTRNQCLQLAKGDFLCFLDADDYLNFDYIEKLYDVATAENIDVVYTDLHCFGADDAVFFVDDFDLELLKNHNYIDMAALIKVSSVNGHNFDENLSKLTHEDWDFFLGLALDDVTFKKIEDTYLNYRIHNDSRNGNSISKNGVEKHLKAYLHIGQKYSNQFPKQYNNLNTYDFIKSEIDGLMNHVENLTIHIENLTTHIEEIQNQSDSRLEHINTLESIIKNMQTSKTWKIGRLITKPLGMVKQMVKQIMKRIIKRGGGN